jgi:hypothetical protein
VLEKEDNPPAENNDHGRGDHEGEDRVFIHDAAS